jgi:hypothetical protein
MNRSMLKLHLKKAGIAALCLIPAHAFAADPLDIPTVAEPKPAVVEVAPAPAPVVKSTVTSKWDSTFYGFIEADTIFDSTQSYSDAPGNALIQGNAKYAGQKPRMQFSIRNSRIGYKIAAPEFGGLKLSGVAEMDFLGNQPGDSGITTDAVNAGGKAATDAITQSESSIWNNPAFRARHLLMKAENAYVDMWFGQTWNLFGGQSVVHPASVFIQGLPGQVYGRTAQIRLLHTFKTEMVNIEIAVAAARAPQRDAAMPDFQGGLKVQLPKWKGVHTNGSTGTGFDPLTVSVSGIYRTLDLSTDPTATAKTTNGWGVSIDAFLPIIPGSLEDRSNALSVTASYVMGAGIADMYSGMSTGVGSPVGNMDKNLAAFDSSKNPVAVKLNSMLFGLQYYLPGNKFWIAGNFSSWGSDNAKDLTTASKALKTGTFFSGALFFDPTPAFRLGAEFAQTTTKLGDDSTATNNRGQFSAFYLF